jgi:hypothetical protein
LSEVSGVSMGTEVFAPQKGTESACAAVTARIPNTRQNQLIVRRMTDE